MSSVIEQQINSLISEINNLKNAQSITENNVVNLLVRSELTVGIISAMIADGLIKKDGVVDFIKKANIDIPGYKETVEGAKSSIIKILDLVKNAE